MSQVTFRGSEINTLLKQVPLGQRAVGNLVKMNESVHGLSHLTFMQDVAVSWLPKVAIARSIAEVTEASYLEFVENALVYYSVPVAGKRVFEGLIKKVAHSDYDPKLLTESYDALAKKLPKEQLAKILPVKAAIILSTLGSVIFAGECALIYGKNLMTNGLFKKDNFTDVANLTNAQESQSKPENPAIQKSKRRVIQSLALAGGSLALAMLLARFGHKSPQLQKPITSLVKNLDFHFKDGRYGLNQKQMYLFMAIAAGAYLDGVRDKFEFKETALRLGIVLPYLAFGHSYLQKLLVKVLGKKHPDVMKPEGGIKSLEQLAEEAVVRAKAKVGNVSDAALLKATAQELSPALRVKNALFGVPLAVGILGTGFGIAIANRLLTAQRYKRSQEKQQGPIVSPIQSGAASVVTPFAMPTGSVFSTAPPQVSASMPASPIFNAFAGR